MGLGLESVSEMTSTMHFITWEESGSGWRAGWGWFVYELQPQRLHRNFLMRI